MGKKVASNKKNTNRKSVIEITIEEGREYVRSANRIRGRKNRAAKRARNAENKARLLERSEKASESSGDNRKVNKNIKKQIHKASGVNPTKKSDGKMQSRPVNPLETKKVPTLKNQTKNTQDNGQKYGKVAELNTNKSKDFKVPDFGFIDVCFCVDATGSMSGELAQVQQVIKTIIKNIQSKISTEGLQLRFAIVTYRDHPPQQSSYVTQHLDFTGQHQAFQYLKTVSAFGGGDEPQAAHDGLLLSAQKLNWAQVEGTPVLRYIFHIADAPPHGKQFLNPQHQSGCLCGLQTDDVIRQINKKSIHYRMIKVRGNQKLNNMQKIFKQKVGDFDSTDISHARQLNVKVSDMIIHQILPDYA